MSCHTNCGDKTCDLELTACYACTTGLHGSKCNSYCPSNCNENKCRQEDGTCFSCERGFYGNECRTLCPINCKDNACQKELGTRVSQAFLKIVAILHVPSTVNTTDVTFIMEHVLNGNLDGRVQPAKQVYVIILHWIPKCKPYLKVWY